jgi:hypothetical protein
MIIIDNFIKDKEFLNEIRNDKTLFDTKGYHWWDGWWNSPADTIKKRLIQYIWRDNCPPDHIYELYGFEYWVGTYSASEVGDGNTDNLNMHFDKDEFWFKETGELRVPIMGTVFYPWEHDIDGGYLEVFSKEGEEPERIAAVPNRLIIFPAGKYPHKVTQVTRGTRYAIAINLWDVEPSGVSNGQMMYE